MNHPDPFATAGSAAAPGRESLWPTILIGWGLACGMLLLTSMAAIANLRFPDPDDAMRLLQVRDWLAGQSWWDVGQHRLNAGDFPMHWSRLVDLPIAAVLALATPLLGEAIATRFAMSLVPLVILLAIMALAAAITRRVAGIAPARLAVLIVPLSAAIIHQARPMRIDHHGWQIMLALAAVLLLLGRPTARHGALAGVALAALLTVSLEGMPIAAAIAGIAALGWALQPERRNFLLGLAWTLFGAACALHVATRGPALLAPACDAIAPAWLAALGVAAIGVTLATTIERHGRAARLAGLVAGGVAAGATLALAAPACLSGPFATLPPMVFKLWYLGVLEGRPLWEQSGYWAAITIGLPIAGLTGSLLAWRAATGSARDRWTILLALLVAATAIALLVNRAGATANALAVPGAAVLLLALLTRARAIESVVLRILATAGALLVASPGQAGGIALTLVNLLDPPHVHLATTNDWHRPACERFADMRAIAALPPGLVFAPIDPSPDILVSAGHRAIAGGYHRSPHAMERVIHGFTAAPDAARRTVLASGADYLVFCPGLNEIDVYREIAPDGLLARLERGERFEWLQPIALRDTPALAWRVVRD